MANEKILIVDDEHTINKLICSCVASEQFHPISAYNGQQAMDLLKKWHPDLIILDVMLPDIEGTALCIEIRKESNAPIIFLSCKSKEVDKIVALSVGGDDYMTKPFMPGELIARIKAHLRRQNRFNIGDQDKNADETIYEFPGLMIDLQAYEIFSDGKSVSVTSKEFEILRLLVENARKVFSAVQIFETIWKTPCLDNDAKTVMVYISTLRKKIESNSENPRYIISVRGVGYKFNQSLFSK